MYERFDLSDQIFVDREVYLSWMDDALRRCMDQSVVLVLRGIGGIGKSSLLDYWNRTIDSTIRLDCDQHTGFYERLNVLAKGAVLLGVSLQRFDVLWQIRQRFVEGVEPVKEKGREWAREIVMAIPFIGSLASIGNAIRSIGAEVAPKIKNRFGSLGQWLQDRLGKDYLAKLLEILWKEPRHAEILFLDALLEDLNNRSNPSQPILFLFDHFEYVDSYTPLWRYAGKKISETELWCVFLSSLSNSVGVLGSRRSVPESADIMDNVEVQELIELDEESTRELLEKRGVTDESIQDRIASVSGGNPFVIDAICDMRDEGAISLDDVEGLRADTLDEVRLKTWRRLFNMASGLQDIINRAGLLESFSREILDIVAPTLTTDLWRRLLQLSFVRARDDGLYVLHNLASGLIIDELGTRGKSLADEIFLLLEKKAEADGDLSLMGLAFSVRAVFSEEEAIQAAKDAINELVMKDAVIDAQKILENLRFHSIKGMAEILGLRSKVLGRLSRLAEAEDAAREAIRILEELSKDDSAKHLDSLAEYLADLHEVLRYTGYDEALEVISRALEIQRIVAEQESPKQLRALARILLAYAWWLGGMHPLESIPYVQEAIAIYERFDCKELIPTALNYMSVMLGRSNKRTESERVIREAIGLQRDVVESDPDNSRAKSALSAMLNNLAVFLDHMEGGLKEADQLSREAFEIRRGLAEKEPDVFLSKLGSQFFNRSMFSFRLHRLDEAEETLTEYLELGEKNFEEFPEVYRTWIEGAHYILSHVHFARGNISQAISAVEKSIGMCRKRLEGGTRDWLYLGAQLNSSAIMYIKDGRFDKAEEALLEAIQIYRESEYMPPRWHAFFAGILNNYGILLRLKDRQPEAKAILEEAMAISLQRSEEVPEVYNGLYSNLLCNLAVILVDIGEMKWAERQFKKSLSIIEDLAQKTPEIYKIHLAIVLHNYANYHDRISRKNEAYSLLERAVGLKHELVEEFPGIFEGSLEKSLSNLAVMEGNVKQQMEWEEKFVVHGEIP